MSLPCTSLIFYGFSNMNLEESLFVFRMFHTFNGYFNIYLHNIKNQSSSIVSVYYLNNKMFSLLLHVGMKIAIIEKKTALAGYVIFLLINIFYYAYYKIIYCIKVNYRTVRRTQ